MPTVKEQKNNLFIISVIDLCISCQVVFHYEINRSFAVTQTKCNVSERFTEKENYSVVLLNE